jgi:hypothetical protein
MTDLPNSVFASDVPLDVMVLAPTKVLSEPDPDAPEFCPMNTEFDPPVRLPPAPVPKTQLEVVENPP